MKVWVLLTQVPYEDSVRTFTSLEAAQEAMSWELDSALDDLPDGLWEECEVFERSAYGPEGFGLRWTIYETEVES